MGDLIELSPARSAVLAALAKEGTGIGWTDLTKNYWHGCVKVDAECRLCLAPETRVLYSDMTWRPIGEVQVGDTLVAFSEETPVGVNRKMELATVEAVWRTMAPTIRLSVGNRTVVASDQHKWLAEPRPYWRETTRLRIGTKLRVMGDPDAAPDIQSEDYRAGYITGATAGDGTMRWDPSWRSDKLGFPQSYWRVAVLEDDGPILERLVRYLAEFDVQVAVRPFTNVAGEHRPMAKVETRALGSLAKIANVMEERSSDNWKAGWLAGMHDTDGHYGTSLRYAQSKDNDVLETVERYGADLGFVFKIERYGDVCPTARLYGRMDEQIRFLGRIQPALERKASAFYGRKFEAPLAEVTGLQRGPVRELVDIQTSTGTFVAEGICTHNCYAETQSVRYGRHIWGALADRWFMTAANNAKPYRWNRVATEHDTFLRVFCGSMFDWAEIHKVPEINAEMNRVRHDVMFPAMKDCTRIYWQNLTKRPENIVKVVPARWLTEGFPSNVWIGTSVGQQRSADKRVPVLLAVPGSPSVRFLSVEPMIGPVDLSPWLNAGISWVIVGGESGALYGKASNRARRMDPDAARRLIDQCREAGVPVFAKQTGMVLAKEWGLKHRKGEEPSEWPEWMQVQQFPEGVAA